MNKSVFFDLQVNGYAGVDFNQDGLTPEQLRTACEKLRAAGVAGILATIISDHADVMARRLARLVELRDRDAQAKELIAGIHIEGPFLNETDGYRGAHPRDAVRSADPDVMELLLDAAGGLTRIVTLAPERDCSLKVTRMLVKRGIVVAAGHCDPSLDQLRAAIDAGLTMFTHLANGCPQMMPRHDNIIQRALCLADRIWLTFIADGVHVPFFVLGNYLRAAGLERCIVVTDAIAAAGLGPGVYTVGRWTVAVGDDLAARAPDGSHLIGSASTMAACRQNLIQRLSLTPRQADTLTAVNPRKAIQLR